MGTISVKEIGHDSRNRVLVGANVTEWRKVWRIEKGYASTRCLGDVEARLKHRIEGV
jgi:hypothetical protein